MCVCVCIYIHLCLCMYVYIEHVMFNFSERRTSRCWRRVNPRHDTSGPRHDSVRDVVLPAPLLLLHEYWYA